MDKLTRGDLMSLEKYAEQRKAFREKVLAHKKNRQVFINEHASLYFEDRLTMQYQIQEMLRIERIFEAEAIQEELDAYNPLIPDGNNLKATFMIEYEDVAERQRELEKLIGIEDKVWIQVNDFSKVYAIANEDLERSNETKTSAVHFMRFEFSPEMVEKARAGAPLAVGVDHENMSDIISALPAETRNALVADFD